MWKPMTDKRPHGRTWLFVGGPCDGERRVLHEGVMRWNVYIRGPIPMVRQSFDPGADLTPCVVEYVPVRGVHGVMAPYGTAPELVVDMLVEKYR